MSGLKLELNMKLTQQLVMTPQLQMAIKLLQMTRLELAEVVAQELEENPTLEESDLEREPEKAEPTQNEDGTGADLEKTLDDHEVTQPLSANDTDVQMASDLEKTMDEVKSNETDVDWDTYFEKYMSGPSDIAPRDTGGEDRSSFEEFYAKESSLYDYLLWQLRFSVSLSDSDLRIGEELIGNINDDGYLGEVSLEEIADSLDVSEEDVQRVQHRIMRFDPVGIGATNLRECLLAQVKFGGNGTPMEAKIIQDHWDLVEKRNVVKLARVLKITRLEAEDAMRRIATLDPKPGAQYCQDHTEFITPDIYIHKIGDDYHIQLNDDGMPRLRVSSYYQRALAEKSNPADTRDFIKSKLRSATWLIRSIQQRQRTIYKVAESIVRQQRDFLERGVKYLKPMVLNNVAEDIGMHECTVSRVTTNKYIHTPRGLFELKYFFNSGITNSDGEDISSESIKTRIKQMVEKENAKKPLSDQKLVSALKEEGIDVARRTVAKYREMLGILSSSGRRRTF